MDRDTLEKALEHISDRHISDAVKPKRRRPYWVGAVAAATAAAILILAFLFPDTPTVPGTTVPDTTTGPDIPIGSVLPDNAIRLAAAPRIMAQPNRSNYRNTQDYNAAFNAWRTQKEARTDTTAAALQALTPFFKDSASVFLSGNENTLWSPVNAYVGLAMLAELAGGESRQQILDLFGTDSIESLREQVAAVFENAYYNNGKEISALANSIWLQEGLTYKEDAMNALAYYYYASIYQGDLAGQEMGQAIADWLNKNTGGLLEDYPPQSLSPLTAVALYSTIYFQSQWQDNFPSNGATGIFHATTGDKEVSYLRDQKDRISYYRGDSFCAVALPLKNGSSMWFILPDEGKTPEDILTEGQYIDMLLSYNKENSKQVKVNLTIPEFDVSGKQDLAPGLEQLGITDVFSPQKANFSSVTGDVPLYVDFINQAVRVQVDGDGVSATAYTEIGAPGSTPPSSEDPVDFILDRPFLFVITGNNIPLFSGVVNIP